MLVSTKGRYATRMLLDIALHQQDGYVVMKEIAERQQISKKYLETFTSQLVDAGILLIRRGKKGGYRLMKAPSDITLLEVIRATEGAPHAVACLECQPNRCARAGFCMSLPAWQGLEDLVTDYLSSITLQQLIDNELPQPENIQDYPCGV